MLTHFTPLLLDNAAANGGGNVTFVAAPLWDIAANIKNQGISFAVYLLMGGTAVVSALSFLVTKNKTFALKTLAVGVVLIGVVGALPSLGVMSRDTVGGLTNSSTR